MPLSEEQYKALDADLDPDRIKTRDGMGYIEGWDAIDRANMIFGYDGWARQTTITQLGEPYTNKNGNHVVNFMASVRITVDDIVREGTGFGSGISGDLGKAFEGAIKEAETDATKRALATFGNQFGLALYDKSQANVEGTPANRVKLAKAKARGLFEELSADIQSSADLKTLEQWASDRKADIEKLPDDWAAILRQEYKARKSEVADRNAGVEVA